MKTKKLISFILLSFMATLTYAQGDVVVSSNVTGTAYWTANNTYHLDGSVFVEPGATLHIEAGTVVKGMPGQGEESSYLCVAKGAQIFAEGTADAPIIFTFEADPLDGSTPLTLSLIHI